MTNFQITNDTLEHGIPMTDESMARYRWARVVRCGDCKWYDEEWCREPDGDGGFKNWYVGRDDFFCASGERRDAQ